MARRGPAKPAKSARANGHTLRPTPMPIPSIISTPISSAHPSTYQSEDEAHFVRISAVEEAMDGMALDDNSKQDVVAGKRPQGPFPFLALPAELRLKVYGFHFASSGNFGNKAIDLDPDNHKRIHKLLPILRTCRTVYSEASHFFYSQHPFRLFPTHYGRFFKTKKPLLARLAPRQRACISTLELRVGPGWNKPPRGWVVNKALGLADCAQAYRLRVFVEFDPGMPAFEGWRKSDGFYEGFCQKLLDDVLNAVPSITEVEFDSNPSIKLSGDMMQGLLRTVLDHRRRVTFGPERGWESMDDADDEVKPPSQLASVASLDLMTAAVPIAVAV